MRPITSLNQGAIPWARNQGRVAQVVERGIHKPEVKSANLFPATQLDKYGIIYLEN